MAGMNVGRSNLGGFSGRGRQERGNQTPRIDTGPTQILNPQDYINRGGFTGWGGTNTLPGRTPPMPNANPWLGRGGFTGGSIPPNPAGGESWNPSGDTTIGGGPINAGPSQMPPSPYMAGGGFTGGMMPPNYTDPNQANIPNMLPGQGMFGGGSPGGFGGLRGAYRNRF